MTRFFKKDSIDFVSKFTIANYASLVFIVLGLLLLLFNGAQLGIDLRAVQN